MDSLLERRDQELRNIPEWRKFWKKLQKKENSEKKVRLDWERHFLQVDMITDPSLTQLTP